MENYHICKSCGTKNSFYRQTCSNCSSFLRDKIYNIDFWSVLTDLIDSPQKAFSTIVYSEHKNFIIPITFFSILKFLILTFLLSVYSVKNYHPYSNFFIYLLIYLALFTCYFLIAAIKLSIIDRIRKTKNRVKDYYAIIIYSLLPMAIGAILLYPIEFISFGEYLFSTNPTAFVLKPTIAYILAGFEILMILWSIFLLIKGVYVQTNKLTFSIITSLLFYAIIFVIIYSCSILFYKPI